MIRHTILSAAWILLAATLLGQPQMQAPKPSQERGQMDGNVALFAVLTAINAAGYDTGLDSPSSHPLRQKIRDYVTKKNPPSVADLKRFYVGHPNLGFSQYVSYALVLQGAPKFNFITNMKELPPEALAAAGMSQILERFWEEAELDKVWKDIQPAYNQLLEQYNEPVSQEVLKANAYLRNVTSGYLGRRYSLYIDFMGAPNQFETRSYGDDYYVVVTPTPKVPVDEIRHAYLFYLLDPLSLKFSNQIGDKRALNKFAQQAPALDEHFKLDYYLLTTACLVKAVETRLAAWPAAQKADRIDEALREGYILTPFFYEHLPLYEKQDKSMRFYYPDMIASINVDAETRRLTAVKWADRRATRLIRAGTGGTPKPKLSGPVKTLEDAEELYYQKQYDQAQQKYASVLKETEIQPYQAKAYYGMARVAAAKKEFELAEKLFEKTLELSPETEVRSWALVFLGRLSYTGCDSESAAKHYQQVLTMEGAPAGARKAAEEGLKDASKDSIRDKCK